jgi:hypothetical protein
MNLAVIDANINYGLLKGWLGAVARINDKTNNGFDFELWKYDGLTTLKQVVEKIAQTNKAKIEVRPIQNPKLQLLKKINFWFFNFQPSRFSAPQFLEDKRGDFSLSDEGYKAEWLEEFVTLLTNTTQMQQLFELKFTELNSYYCNLSDDFIVKGKENFFQLHFCLSD